MADKKQDLRQQLLLAALECSKGDLDRTFSSEELLVAAWQRNPTSWGLRGYERAHPDSNRIHRELDSRGKGQDGIVGQGLLERVRPRTYRLTPKGLEAAAKEGVATPEARERIDRVFEEEVKRIISHPAFVGWLRDVATPKNFRDAGHFWGVAPGTPPRVVTRRVEAVEDTLRAALALLEARELDEVGDKQGRLLFDRTDIERGLEFQEAMKQRFSKELLVLSGEPARRESGASR
jgi:hypothetical protein